MSTAIEKPTGADIHRLWSGEHRHEVARGEPKLSVVEDWIGNHPVLCLGAGLVAGAVLGWLVKRK